MTFDDYRKIPALNWSLISTILESPLAFAEARATERADTAAFRLGRAFHCATLEPDEFPIRYGVVADDWLAQDRLHRGKKEGKAAWAEWLATHPEHADLSADDYKIAVYAEEHPGQEVISRADYDQCLRMRDAVHAHPAAGPMVRGPGQNEHSIEWTDPGTGLRCKARLDRIAGGCLIDLKSAETIDGARFGQSAARYRYHGQAAWYQRGWEVLTGERLPFYFIACEKRRPHDVAVFDCDEDSIDLGRADVDAALARFVECSAAGTWPGRYQSVVSLQLPRWVYPDDGDLSDLDLDFNTEG